MSDRFLAHTVREARRTDVPSLLKLEQNIFVQADGMLSRRAFVYHIRSSNLVLVATPKSNLPAISGYILVLIRSKTARIYSLATAQEYRHQGVAKTLIAASLKHVSSLGVAKVTLELRSGNTAAQRLYESYGFELKKVREGYYGDGEAALFMTRNSADFPSI